MRPEECPACKGTRPGYCAPRRCYCHHTQCPAIYEAGTQPNAATRNTTTAKWDQRNGPTWIDNL